MHRADLSVLVILVLNGLKPVVTRCIEAVSKDINLKSTQNNIWSL